MEGREISFSILQMICVFFSNILLMNYLIAILSITYDNMKQSAIFRYKVNLYEYCERYMIAFDELSYGELILHPPPISYLAVLLIPFIVSRRAMISVTKYFSYVNFWLENFIIGLLFFMVELIACPFVYMKIWWNIVWSSLGFVEIMTNIAYFTIFGIPLILFLVVRDCAYFIYLLTYL
jgi:hypothetical protein